jgi:cytochrome c55X
VNKPAAKPDCCVARCSESSWTPRPLWFLRAGCLALALLATVFSQASIRAIGYGLVGLPVAAACAAESPGLQRQQELANLLQQDCGSCHGLQFKGGLGPPLLPDHLRGKPDSLLIETILNGRTGTAMPPWRGLLTESEAAWLVERLRGNRTEP